MPHTLQIGTSSTDGWGANDSADAWTYDAVNTVKCNLFPGATTETTDGAEYTITDCDIVVPIGTSVDRGNRLKVTHKFGAVLGTAEVYAIKGEPQDRTACLRMNCTRVLGNSRK